MAQRFNEGPFVDARPGCRRRKREESVVIGRQEREGGILIADSRVCRGSRSRIAGSLCQRKNEEENIKHSADYAEVLWSRVGTENGQSCGRSQVSLKEGRITRSKVAPAVGLAPAALAAFSSCGTKPGSCRQVGAVTLEGRGGLTAPAITCRPLQTCSPADRYLHATAEIQPQSVALQRLGGHSSALCGRSQVATKYWICTAGVQNFVSFYGQSRTSWCIPPENRISIHPLPPEYLKHI